MSRSRETYSLFGECEVIVAKQMMAEGKDLINMPLTFFDAIPDSVKFNHFGDQVKMVVTFATRDVLREFNRRVEDIRI